MHHAANDRPRSPRISSHAPRRLLLVPGIALIATACAVPPPAGPSVMALPGQGKNFEAFQQDDVACRQYAWQQTGGTAPGAAARRARSAAPSPERRLAPPRGPRSERRAARPVRVPRSARGRACWQAARWRRRCRRNLRRFPQLYDISYTQCMTAQGNSVQAPPTYAAYPYPSYPYPVTQLSVSTLSLSLPLSVSGPLRTGVVRAISYPRLWRRMGLGQGWLGWRQRLGRGGLGWARPLASLIPILLRPAGHGHAAHPIVTFRPPPPTAAPSPSR